MILRRGRVLVNIIGALAAIGLIIGEKIYVQHNGDVHSAFSMATQIRGDNHPVEIARNHKLVGAVVIPQDTPKFNLTEVGVAIGNYSGMARGMIVASVCVEQVCTDGHADLEGSADNEPIYVKLGRAVQVQGGDFLTFAFADESTGHAFAIWLWNSPKSATQSLELQSGSGELVRKFAGAAAKIFFAGFL